MADLVSFGRSNWVERDLCTQVDGKWVLKSEIKKQRTPRKTSKRGRPKKK